MGGPLDLQPTRTPRRVQQLVRPTTATRADEAPETTHRFEIEANLQGNDVSFRDLAVEDSDEIAAYCADVKVGSGSVPIVADACYDFSSANRVSDLNLNLLDVHVADLHWPGVKAAESLKEDGSRGIWPPSPRLIRGRVSEDEPDDSVEGRKKRLIPTEPVLVTRSVTFVEPVEVARLATIATIYKAVRSQGIARMVL